MNKIKSYMTDLRKITWVNFRTAFSIPNLIGMFVITFIGSMGIIFMDKFDDTLTVADQAKTILGAEGALMGGIKQLLIYSFFIRIIAVFKDRSNFDANRVAFMTKRKGQVVFSKVFADAWLFITPILILAGGGAMYIIQMKGFDINLEILDGMIPFAIGLMFVYLVSSIGIRYITSLSINKHIRGWILTGWVISTVTYAIVFGNFATTFGVTTKILIDMKYMFAFTPIINLATPFFCLEADYEWWTIMPLVVETLIVLAVLWKQISKIIKTHLCI